ncbi:encapsulin [Mesorhizobium sp. BAC0120]|uniref:encapsulin n=1 Tax=Mesorhizobium sp. BAC0120 TaxID=3090670 RepID=UPI00298C79A0|nr:encapsulin [Mesorhizobium sp. BAC0120]MDW6025078.1 encapsulin [Mesorhizobium sp. BAC0120]
MAELNWDDAQWQKVNEAVKDGFSKASVSSQFLRHYGPLSGSAEIVRNEIFGPIVGGGVLTLITNHPSVNRQLVNLTTNVELSSEQAAEETLSNAVLLFRRAGNILAQEEDRIIFAGFHRGSGQEDSQFVANNVEPQDGLADLPTRRNFNPLINPATLGNDVVEQVVNAVGLLEDRFNPGPFACILGNRLFEEVHRPTPNLVLPADRITPMLKGGFLLRSGQMDAGTGVVVSQAGDTIDVVVGTDPVVQFLQRTGQARFLFRVYERFVLRIRDQNQAPVTGFRIGPTAAQRAAERLALDANAALYGRG